MCLVSKDSGRGTRSPGARVKDSCEPPRGCWKPDLGPLQEEPAFLAAKPSLQSHPFVVFLMICLFVFTSMEVLDPG